MAAKVKNLKKSLTSKFSSKEVTDEGKELLNELAVSYKELQTEKGNALTELNSSMKEIKVTWFRILIIRNFLLQKCYNCIHWIQIYSKQVSSIKKLFYIQIKQSLLKY